jgi:hypothetical protein
MGKIIRPRYPVEFSVGLLLLIFGLSLFFSHEVFRVPGVNRDERMYFGMFLVSSAIIIMLLVLWEEFLFPITIKPIEKGLVFRNHRNKLKTQALIYTTIPIIFVFIYLNYEVNLVPFIVCAAICIMAPVLGKLISGIRNYNDYLTLMSDAIEYKNNEKGGIIKHSDIQHIILIKDERKVLHKIRLITTNNKEEMIDLDEMELEEYYHTIDKFISKYYKSLLKVDESESSANK